MSLADDRVKGRRLHQPKPSVRFTSHTVTRQLFLSKATCVIIKLSLPAYSLQYGVDSEPSEFTIRVGF